MAKRVGEVHNGSLTDISVGITSFVNLVTPVMSGLITDKLGRTSCFAFGSCSSFIRNYDPSDEIIVLFRRGNHIFLVIYNSN